MKPLKESFIKAKDLNKLGWPNPYKLTKEDAIGEIDGWPLEIITLILHEIDIRRNIRDFDLTDLQRMGLDCAFVWDKSKDGQDFWKSIRDERFDVFYDKYTPTKLKERLKEK